MQLKSLRARWITMVVGVGLVGTAAVTVVAVSVSLLMSSFTVRGWLTGEAVNIRGSYDRQLLARFKDIAVDAARDLDASPRHELAEATAEAFAGVDAGGSSLWGVANERGSFFAGGKACQVPKASLRPLNATTLRGLDSWVVRFSCHGRPALGVASQSRRSGLVAIAGQLLDESYVDALSEATQLEVTMFGGGTRPITSMRDRAGRRLDGQAFPPGGFGSATLHVPGYRGYFGEPTHTGEGDVDEPVYFAAVDLAPEFEGVRLAFSLPRALILKPTVFTAAMLLVTMMVMLAAMVLIARRLARKIADPVHTLATMTRRVADGDLDAQVGELDGADELHELGVSFNRMVCSLKDLRRRVFQTEKLAAVGQLSASVAHEINNPLAYIIGNLSFAIERVRSGEPLEDALEESLEGAKRIAQIVRDLKTFSRSEDDQAEHSRVDVETTLDSAVKMAGNRIRHRARLVKNYAPVGEVLANPGRLAQVFLNLLVNAADAIAPGRADENQILLTLEQRHGEAVVEITDTGVGIPDEVRARLFEPFFTTKPIGVGTGLGLSICKNIVEAAGGQIAILPGPAHRGTTVRVSLPLAPAVKKDDEITQQVEITPARCTLSRLLVIDDDPAVLRSVKRMLEPAYKVVTVSSATAALERLGAGERFDLLICDLMMPEVTGIELHQHLTRSCPALSKRMLFITGGAFTPDAAPFLDENRQRVLEKPIGPARLREAVQSAIAASAAA